MFDQILFGEDATNKSVALKMEQCLQSIQPTSSKRKQFMKNASAFVDHPIVLGTAMRKQ